MSTLSVRNICAVRMVVLVWIDLHLITDGANLSENPLFVKSWKANKWCVPRLYISCPGHCTLLEFVSITQCLKRDPVLNGLLTSEGKQLIEAGLFKEYVHWALIWCWRWTCNVAKKKIRKLIPCWLACRVACRRHKRGRTWDRGYRCSTTTQLMTIQLKLFPEYV